MMELNERGVPKLLWQIISEQLKAVHQMTIEPCACPELNQQVMEQILHTLTNSGLCMHCFNVHENTKKCDAFPEWFQERLEKHEPFQTLTVIFPFRKARPGRGRNSEQSRYGRIYVRVLDLGYLCVVLNHVQDTQDWRQLHTVIGGEVITSRMYRVRDEGFGHISMRVETPYEKKELLTGAKARPIKVLCQMPDTHTLTATRGDFNYYMIKQLENLHQLYGRRDLTDSKIDKLCKDIGNPPICYKCGSWHNPVITDCIVNVLMHQGKMQPSRKISIVYIDPERSTPENTVFGSLSVRILDGGNFKREVFVDYRRNIWSEFSYYHRETGRLWFTTMCLVAPDCFFIRDMPIFADTPLPPPVVKYKRQLWMTKWYDDPSDEERLQYIPLIKEAAPSLTLVSESDLDQTQLRTPQELDPKYLMYLPDIVWAVDRFPEFGDYSLQMGSTNGYFSTHLGSRPKGPQYVI